MSDEWLYTCAGMHIVRGLKQYATNGFIGVDAAGDIVLFNNKGEEFDRASARTDDGEAKYGFTGTTVTLNGTKYRLEFRPLGQKVGLGIGGAVGAAIAGDWLHAKGDDTRSEKQKRQELLDVVTALKRDDSGDA